MTLTVKLQPFRQEISESSSGAVRRGPETEGWWWVSVKLKVFRRFAGIWGGGEDQVNMRGFRLRGEEIWECGFCSGERRERA